MNVREALEKLLNQEVQHCDSYDDDARLLAPIIKRALRAAYRTGIRDMLDGLGNTSENGVTAGVAAMMEQDHE